eukprot:TRINITY_DN16104_c0_g1_i1.p1 TRINITY_DN16104_c0_g1~~TRINITY_DN16104_c0_g1_i1.p1  ORF type:complete len:504 (-),score=88.65 TRINITY_DN16104_c0_g1_i1:261-1772(-)
MAAAKEDSPASDDGETQVIKSALKKDDGSRKGLRARMPTAFKSNMELLKDDSDCDSSGHEWQASYQCTRGQRAVRRALWRLRVDAGMSDSPQPIPQSPCASTPLAKRLTRAESLVEMIDETRGVFAERFPILQEMMSVVLTAPYMVYQCIRWFRFGFVATYFAFRLIIFGAMLLPAFLPIVYSYFRDPRVQRRIRFGPHMRNFIDVYIPPEAHAALQGKGPPVPVVVAIMGGAWIIGHRAWNVQLGLRLTEAGVMTVAIDYRNFPIGGVPEMTEDLSRGIQWVFQHIASFGGDPTNVALIAQSAGAHLSSTLLLEHSLMEAQRKQKGSKTTDGWSVSNFKGAMLVSGPYDLVILESHLASRGLYSRILHHFCVNGDVAGCSPSKLLDTQEWRDLAPHAAPLLPPILLFHGKADKTVPYWSTEKFADSLKKAGVKNVETDIREGVAHAEIVVEGPMRGQEFQVEPLLPFLFGKEKAKEICASMKPLKCSFPRPIIELASKIMPF